MADPRPSSRHAASSHAPRARRKPRPAGGNRNNGNGSLQNRANSESRSAAQAAAPTITEAAIETVPVQSFAQLGVPERICLALEAQGLTHPFPIQALTLRDALAGRDVLGRGRTGSGKTLAFAIPVIARLAATNERRQSRQPRAVILAPTRELARQIHATLEPLGAAAGIRSTTIFGGVPAGPQINVLRRGVDVVVACPGRLDDLARSGHVHLDAVEITVLDEADHMADLGFMPTVARILDATPDDAQRLLFSATLDQAVDTLVRRYLHDPVVHHAPADTASVGEMSHHVFHITTADRLPILVDLTSAPGKAVVFTRTKHRARQLTKQLVAAGVPAVEMHGNLAQSVRTRNLAAFAEGRATALVATDIAARGIHIDEVGLVVHADPPVEHKSYLHRSGRTARAGAAGTVVTLATEEQRREVRSLSRKAGIEPTVTTLRPGHPMLEEVAPGPRRLDAPAEIAAALAAPPARPAQQPRNGAPRSNQGRPQARRRRRTGGGSRS